MVADPPDVVPGQCFRNKKFYKRPHGRLDEPCVVLRGGNVVSTEFKCSVISICGKKENVSWIIDFCHLGKVPNT